MPAKPAPTTTTSKLPAVAVRLVSELDCKAGICLHSRIFFIGWRQHSPRRAKAQETKGKTKGGRDRDGWDILLCGIAQVRHYEACDEAIQLFRRCLLDCFASLATTLRVRAPRHPR